MRILLKLELDSSPDAAWAAVRSPAVFQQVSAPIMRFSSLEPDGYPESWPAGEHPVAAKAVGLVPVGRQVVRIGYPPERDGVRRVLDTGFGVSGIFTTVTSWHHTMAISPASGGRTLYRDELRFEAGRMTLLLWPVYWVFWQWRAARLTQLARGWRS